MIFRLCNYLLPESKFLHCTQILLESIEYMLQLPLPGIRIDFIHAFNYWLKISDDNIRMIADITHAIYVAGLM